MAPPPQSVAEAGVQAIADRLNQALSETNSMLLNPGAVVANDSPANAALIPLIATSRAVCRAWTREGVGQNAGVDDLMGGLCNQYLGDIGELPISGDLESPFSGGQCAALYRAIGTLDYVRLFCSSGTRIQVSDEPYATEFILQGPITAIAGRVVNPGTCGAQSWGLFAQTGTGEVLLAQVLGVNGTFSIVEVTFTVTLERAGGLPDNCGNPPPDYTAPRTAPGLPPYSPVVPFPGTDDGIRVDFDFNPDGTINIGLPDLGVDVDINPVAGGGSGGGAAPGDVGEPGAAIDGDGEPVEGEAPPGEVLGGVLVELLEPFGDSSEFFGGNFRGQYYVYMGTDSGLAQVQGSALVRQTQFFLPPQENLTRWQVSPNPGATIRATPYYRAPDEES